MTELGGNQYYNWVVTIYLLTSTITVPFYGKLSDLYGRKPLLMAGVIIFLIGSALSGLSQNMAMLIFFRGIQGIGAGALFPIALAVIGDLFTPAERGRYQGLFGAVFGISFLIGPAIGGLLTDNISWHWIFYVNIPVGLVSLFVLARLLPTIKRPNATRNLDIPGALVFTVAISMLLVGLDQQAVGRLVRPVGRRPDRRLGRPCRPVRLHRVAGEGADHPARDVPEPDVHVIDHLDVPGQLRLLRRDHLPAALVPVRERLVRDRVGLPDLPAAHRAHRELDRVGHPRVADRQVQGASS